ncbi:MAG: hypothetical protein HW421_2767 [Ignavibacteria bacterium]|nr:hypothetical protein [Ignavibacteria bacterium]
MSLIKFDEVESKIIQIRGENVIIDSDIADLYNVETRDINKAVKNNPDKFPKDYILELSKKEKNELVEIFHRFDSLKHSTVNPKAFTEKGLYMLATILKSPMATQTTISIIETFANIKKLSRNIREISIIDDESKKKSLLQKSGEIISEILDDNLHIDQSETTIELNFALIKVKHTIKRK